MATNAENGTSNSVEDIRIRPATPDDCEEVMRLITELATFENLQDQVVMDVDTFRRDCFNDHPKCYCFVAEQVPKGTKEIIGYTIYLITYSSWEGEFVHLEDIYVTPPFRGQGIGKKLWQAVVRVALRMGCRRTQHSVLGWNKRAKDWYERAGCINLTETRQFNLMRMTPESMKKFVKS